MGSGGVAIAALPTVICLKVPFSDGLGGGSFFAYMMLYLFRFFKFFAHETVVVCKKNVFY